MSARFSLSELGLTPLTARSVALSALLGEHPPRLPGRALVALGELLDVAPSAMRTALSRMVAAGEVTTRDGVYELGHHMVRRQQAQDSGLLPPPEPWDSTWWFVIVDADRRPLRERRAFRSRMRQSRMGELRPEIWLRPANIEGPTGETGTLVARGLLQERAPEAVAGALWELDRLAEQSLTLQERLEDALRWMQDDPADPASLVDASVLTVAVLRFLLAEPRLPLALVGGSSWPPNALREVYDRFAVAYRALRSQFLAAEFSCVTKVEHVDHSP